MTKEERELLGEVVEDVYQQFIEAVVEDRGVSQEEVLGLADGRLLSGYQAYEAGLVDTLGTLEDAICIAADMAGIKGEPKVVRARLRVPIWRWILEGVAGRLLYPRFLFR
jgi:protease-4